MSWIPEALMGVLGLASSNSNANKASRQQDQALAFQKQMADQQWQQIQNVMPLYNQGLNFFSQRAGLGNFNPNGDSGGNGGGYLNPGSAPIYNSALASRRGITPPSGAIPANQASFQNSYGANGLPAASNMPGYVPSPGANPQMQYGLAPSNPYAPMTGKGDANAAMQTNWPPAPRYQDMMYNPMLDAPGTLLTGKGDGNISGGGTNTSMGDAPTAPNPQALMAMMGGQDPGMTPAIRMAGYNPMNPIHMDPLAYYSQLMQQQEPQQQGRQGYGPDTGQGDPNGLPAANPALAQQQAMSPRPPQQMQPAPGRLAPFGAAPGLNGGNPFALYGSRKTLPGVQPAQPPTPGQGPSQQQPQPAPQQQAGQGNPYLGGQPLTGGVANSQLGIYNSGEDALRNAQAQDDMNGQLRVQEDQLLHNLGQRGLANSSVYGGALAQLQNNALSNYGNFRRQLAINSGDEQANRVQQMMQSLNPAFGQGGIAANSAQNMAGNSMQQNAQSQMALNNLLSQMAQYFGTKPGQSSGAYSSDPGMYGLPLS